MTEQIGWDYIDRPIALEAIATLAREIINRPDTEVRVMAKYNPDSICIAIRRNNGKKSSPQLEGASVVFFAHESLDTIAAQARCAAHYLATAPLQAYPEATSIPTVYLSEIEVSA